MGRHGLEAIGVATGVAEADLVVFAGMKFEAQTGQYLRHRTAAQGDALETSSR